jgi:hypothetical protein
MYASLVVVYFQKTDIFNFVVFVKVIGTVSVITTANRYLPIPGGEGMMQLQMRILLLYQEGSSSENVDSAIFV